MPTYRASDVGGSGTKVAASDNPFRKLTKEQLSQLSEIAATRDRKARGDKNLSRGGNRERTGARRKLQQAGIDVDGMLAKRKEMHRSAAAR